MKIFQRNNIRNKQRKLIRNFWRDSCESYWRNPETFSKKSIEEQQMDILEDFSYEFSYLNNYFPGFLKYFLLESPEKFLKKSHAGFWRYSRTNYNYLKSIQRMLSRVSRKNSRKNPDGILARISERYSEGEPPEEFM